MYSVKELRSLSLCNLVVFNHHSFRFRENITRSLLNNQIWGFTLQLFPCGRVQWWWDYRIFLCRIYWGWKVDVYSDIEERRRLTISDKYPESLFCKRIINYDSASIMPLKGWKIYFTFSVDRRDFYIISRPVHTSSIRMKEASKEIRDPP